MSEGALSYTLVRRRSGPRGLDLASFASAAGLHPELVRRLVALGLLEPELDAAGAPWFPPSQLAAVARIQRLRAGFALNYAALGLVIDLLERIAELESAARRPARQAGRQPSQPEQNRIRRTGG